MRGTFGVLVGVDGSGKTALCNHFRESQSDVLVTSWHEFGGVFRVGKNSDHCSERDDTAFERLGGWSKAAALAHIVALQLDEIVIPALERGQHVIADSFWFKFVAKNALLRFTCANLEALFTQMPRPDMVFYVGVPPDVAVARRPLPGIYDQGEAYPNRIEFLDALDQELRQCCAEYPTVWLDGCKSIQENVQLISSKLCEAQCKSLLGIGRPSQCDIDDR